MARLQCVAEQVEDVLLLDLERLRAGGVLAEERTHERRVGQVGEDRPVRGDHEAAGVAAADPSRVHLALEEERAALEQRAQHHRQLLDQHRSALERLPARQAHEVGTLHEEPERGADDPLHLRPPLGGLHRGGVVHEARDQSSNASRRTAR